MVYSRLSSRHIRFARSSDFVGIDSEGTIIEMQIAKSNDR